MFIVLHDYRDKKNKIFFRCGMDINSDNMIFFQSLEKVGDDYAI